MIMYKECSSFAGRVLAMASSKVEVKVTLDVGPRILSLKFMPDGNNIFFEDEKDAINKDVSESYGKGKTWHIYGGTRMWLSPEEDKTYVPDNDPVRYEKIENGAIFVPNAWEKHGVQPKLVIEFLEEDKIKVSMQARNISKKTIPICIWALSVCRSGGKMVVPISKEDTGYLPNRNIVHWPYNDIADRRYAVTNDAIFMASNPRMKNPFKIGTHLPSIIAQYMIEDSVFIKEVKVPKGASYPDFHCNFETYTNNLIHEIETLSPITITAPGDKLVHEEIWTVKKAKKSWVENTERLQLNAPTTPIIYL